MVEEIRGGDRSRVKTREIATPEEPKATLNLRTSEEEERYQ